MLASTATTHHPGQRPSADVKRRLHDVIVPQVFLLATGLTAIDRHPGRDDTKQIVSELLLTANRVLADLRSISRGESSQAVESVGELVEELRRATAFMAENESCRIDLECPISDLELSADLCADIRAVLWEASINAIRHGRATLLEVSVKMRDGTIVVEVADNGVWAGSNQIGTGLIGLRCRAETRGGSVKMAITTEGTIIRWAVPHKLSLPMPPAVGT